MIAAFIIMVFAQIILGVCALAGMVAARDEYNGILQM